MAAVVGLIGALLGALMTQLGAVLTDHRQVRTEAIRWNRDQKTAAYDNTIRHLLRAANRRSALTGEFAYIDKAGVRQLFEDLVEAQFWIHTLVTRCDVSQTERITQALQLLDSTVERAGSSEPNPSGKGKLNLMATLQQVLTTVTECAREDRRAPHRPDMTRKLA